MTTPSPHEPTPPGGQPGSYGQQPHGQAPYGQQPYEQQPYGQPAPYGGSGGPSPYGGAPAGRRPGTVTAAAVIGIVWGAIGALFSLLVMLAAFSLGATLIGLLLLLSLAAYVALLAGGISVLQGKSPKLLLYTAYALVALGLLSFVLSLFQDGGNAASGIIGLLITAAIAVLLQQPQSKQHFAARGTSY
ncbi:hypothetical protein SAMN05660359_02989 [Geodermatophilus obscurus]|uniref:Uncharacterized protein n=1 Tax=Geodermatophilus obscurus TaxID=1861 RepID=A0A1I5GP43_9ACTN|nr:hypothetical protein [Geodermatophilus obscurus]SFO37788.1 hypothetical protein SAMN05660359_02989 [Geodermatophilus obscurus]